MLTLVFKFQMAKIVDQQGHSKEQGNSNQHAHRDGIVRGKGKSVGAVGTSGKAYSRFNCKYFGRDIVGKLDERKKNIIKQRGFGRLLKYDGCSAPRGFVKWIADQVDVNCYDILVVGKVIPCSPLSLNLFLGIPLGGEDVNSSYSDSNKAEFLKKIGESSLPSIKSLGQKLLGNTLDDDNVFRYFMLVALATFLCPNSSTFPSPKYFGALLDVSRVREFDWSKYVFEWLFSSIKNYRRKHRGTIGGCIYFLAVSALMYFLQLPIFA